MSILKAEARGFQAETLQDTLPDGLHLRKVSGCFFPGAKAVPAGATPNLLLSHTADTRTVFHLSKMRRAITETRVPDAALAMAAEGASIFQLVFSHILLFTLALAVELSSQRTVGYLGVKLAPDTILIAPRGRRAASLLASGQVFRFVC